MYTLYFLPNACSLATQAILHELQQPLRLINKNDVADFDRLNAVGSVPVLTDGDNVYREGVAILLHVLDKHDNQLLPKEALRRHSAIENMLFANATMHPAYGRLFFLDQQIQDVSVKESAMAAVAVAISELWNVVEQRLVDKSFLGGEKISAADFLLCVYSRWNEYFSVDIKIGPNTRKMLNAVTQRESFQKALAMEAEYLHRQKSA